MGANSIESLSLIDTQSGLEQAIQALQRISNRTSGKEQENAMQTVMAILKDIETNGDKALINYTERFDNFRPKTLEIQNEEIVNAWNEIPSPLKTALELAYKRIKAFHERQLPSDIEIKGEYGEYLGRRWRPVKKAGIYIPGGRASYPSTVLMNAIPALVAGVKEVVMVSPPGRDGKLNQSVLAAAHIAGVNKVFNIGGAQAIGALAYGTESIEPVDVITGPGNIYVTLAKKNVYGVVGIDSLAGPSEVLIIADQTAKVEQVASDLLAQAEHDPLAAAILITTSQKLTEAIPKEINKQLHNHPRAEICLASLKEWGLIITCQNLEEAILLSDKFAPEHLELLVEDSKSIAGKVNNAGAIFLGEWTPEAVGDYLAGPNHTLPTSGSSRFSGALSVETFMKNTSLIEFTKEAFDNTSKEIITLANSEGLYSHSESIKIRSSEIN